MDLDFIVINIGRIVCSNIVFTFVSAQIIDLPWETSVRSWGIEGYKPIQEKFIQLAFLRRYPKLFYNERFNLNRRAELLGSPLDSVRNSLLAKVNSSPSTEVDLIEKGYSAANMPHLGNQIHNLRPTLAFWRWKSVLCVYLTPQQRFHR
ncbi:hypothetical protein VP01_1531g1 [Puccinia sorghi]|uniref:Uncharacterized protein n=1 Tax=Puccinia sorghi TaxID=27349 RepID=A0A0L6VIV1_9BASI|nr:hypothetical protein VP01_1548g1 [Puccinia sorghi]KNZ60593.1 hypothetical protein VP01_1531g1 [Puccinia sorghi]